MGLNAQVLGISVDHIPCLQAWATSLGGISYPLMSDFWPHGAVAEKYGVLREEGYTERAIFVIDKDGIIRYIDIHDIEQQPDNEEVRRILREIDPEAAAASRALQPPNTVTLPKKGILLFCTKWCPACRKARELFASLSIPYTEVDVNTTPGASEQVKTWAEGNRTTPTFYIDGAVVVDWNEDALRKTLTEKGYL